MSIKMGNEKNILPDTEAGYEMVASQEDRMGACEPSQEIKLMFLENPGPSCRPMHNIVQRARNRYAQKKER